MSTVLVSAAPYKKIKSSNFSQSRPFDILEGLEPAGLRQKADF